jgi:hypothetical protein
VGEEATPVVGTGGRGEGEVAVGAATDGRGGTLSPGRESPVKTFKIFP